MNSIKNLWIEVSKDYLTSNLNNVKTLVGERNIIAVVKSDAYGHDAVSVSKHLENNVQYFAVTHVDEGIFLRENGIVKPILVLSPYFGGVEVIQHSLTPTISSIKELDELYSVASKQNTTIKFHLKVNTGMNRFGINLDETPELLEKLNKYKNLEVEGVYSHFSSDLNKNKDFTTRQLIYFKAMIEKIKKVVKDISFIHIANTKAVVLGMEDSFFNTVRVGNALYGKASHSELDFKDAYQVKTKIISVRSIKKGEYLGYNLSFKAKKDTVVGILPVGTYDGLLMQRRDPNPMLFDLLKVYIKKYVRKNNVITFNGKPLKVIGNPCTQFTFIDITEYPELKVGSVLDVHIPIFSAKNHIQRIIK